MYIYLASLLIRRVTCLVKELNLQLSSCGSFHEMGRLLLEVMFFTESDPFFALLSNLIRF